jgi:hypothetical protein
MVLVVMIIIIRVIIVAAASNSKCSSDLSDLVCVERLAHHQGQRQKAGEMHLEAHVLPLIFQHFRWVVRYFNTHPRSPSRYLLTLQIVEKTASARR